MYRNIWVPVKEENRHKVPTNAIKKYVVAGMKVGYVVGHLKREK